MTYFVEVDNITVVPLDLVQLERVHSSLLIQPVTLLLFDFPSLAADSEGDIANLVQLL